MIAQPTIRRRCALCEQIDPWWPDDVPGVVSPTGIEHIGVDFGNTLCGHDATGDKWWWPL